MKNWENILEIGDDCDERFVDRNKVSEMEQLDINISGVSNLKGHYRVGRNSPISHAILYSVEGAIKLHTEEGVQVVEKCNLITLPAHKPYLMELEAPLWNMVWFDLNDGDRWRELCIHRPTVARCDSGRQLFHLLSFIYYEKNKDLRKPAIKQLEYYIEETLCAPLPGSSESQRIDQLIRDMEKRLHCPWSIAEMSELIQYSAPHLHRLFQSRFGRSPIQHLIFLRMERAKYLLNYTTWSIEQIAEQVGYQDVFNFSKRFKKSVGIAPGQYRRALA